MIAAPPAVVGDFLLLPVNLLLPVKDVPGKAAIRVLAISKDTKGEPLRAVQMIGVEGTLDSTPVAVENGAGVVTAQGGLFRASSETGPLFGTSLSTENRWSPWRPVTWFPAAAGSGWPTGI